MGKKNTRSTRMLQSASHRTPVATDARRRRRAAIGCPTRSRPDAVAAIPPPGGSRPSFRRRSRIRSSCFSQLPLRSISSIEWEATLAERYASMACAFASATPHMSLIRYKAEKLNVSPDVRYRGQQIQFRGALRIYEYTPNFVTLSAHRGLASTSNVFRNTSAPSRSPDRSRCSGRQAKPLRCVSFRR